jgi:opacity protein-like surface antigen
MMKMILVAALVTAALASSAMAQSYDPAVGSGNIVPNTAAAPAPYFRSGDYIGARAYAPESNAYEARASARGSYAYAPRHHLRYRDMQGHSDMDRE